MPSTLTGPVTAQPRAARSRSRARRLAAGVGLAITSALLVAPAAPAGAAAATSARDDGGVNPVGIVVALGVLAALAYGGTQLLAAHRPDPASRGRATPPLQPSSRAPAPAATAAPVSAPAAPAHAAWPTTWPAPATGTAAAPSTAAVGRWPTPPPAPVIDAGLGRGPADAEAWSPWRTSGSSSGHTQAIQGRPDREGGPTTGRRSA